MYELKQFKMFTCMVCLSEVERYTDQEPTPIYMCGCCKETEKYKTRIIVIHDGAPMGRVAGSRNPCRNRFKPAFTKPEKSE